MSRRAWAYIIGVMLTGAAFYAAASLRAPAPVASDWVTLAVLGVLATVAQLSKVLFWSSSASGATSTSYSPMLIVLFAGVLLLPPAALGLLVVIPHLAEWLKERLRRTANLPAWYLQPFNIANHLIGALAAQGVFLTLAPALPAFVLPWTLLALFISSVVYTACNHIVLGWALVLARGLSWRKSGVLDQENLLADFMLMLHGGAAGLLWTISPWLILLVIPPLVLIQRALMVPQLEQESRIDPRTGLWNMRKFEQSFASEFGRAQRLNRSLALMMADLDYLRAVNNTHGHLAGDAVLAGIGELVQQTIRHYDIAARLGGEEFAVLLPETNREQARALAERLRSRVESRVFATPDASLHVTISIGVACYPMNGATTFELIKAADAALYAAKANGRNQVVLSEERTDDEMQTLEVGDKRS